MDAEDDHDRTNGHGGVYHIISEHVCMLHAIQTPRKFLDDDKPYYDLL